MKKTFLLLTILSICILLTPATATATILRGGWTDSLGVVNDWRDTLTIDGTLYYISRPMPVTNTVIRLFEGPDSTVTLLQRYAVPHTGSDGITTFRDVWKQLHYLDILTQTYGTGTYAFDGVHGKLQSSDPGTSGTIYLAVTPQPASPIYYDAAW